MTEQLNKLEKIIQISFSNKQLLKQALVHKSYANEANNNVANNERLEFLGDSVLDLAVSSYLYDNFSQHPEGKLAKMRAVLVSENMLAQKAGEIQLGAFLLLGRGEENTGGRERKSILADTLEALLGAIYLDKDYYFCEKFILNFFTENFKSVARGEYIKDYKTKLQEFIQQDNLERPEYSVLKVTGPDHNKTFTIGVLFKGKQLGTGTASSKKEAQQKAARSALEKLGQL